MSRASSLLLTRAVVQFPRPQLTDVPGTVRAELDGARRIFPASGSIAVAVGSRGITNIAEIVRTAIDVLKSWGLAPFIIPAMGSHGGGTAEGQRDVLSDYGVTEARMGCEIRSSMDVVELERGDLPHGLFMDQHAFAADGVLLVNRIKPHTDFQGPYESGLAKMAVIGLGKRRQAVELHGLGLSGLRDNIPRAAARIVATGRVVAGLAIVENAYDETMTIEAVPASALLAREPALLQMARRHMPVLPVDTLDVLIVDQMGKNISGCGMDTNVIGRKLPPTAGEVVSPRITNVVVADLTEASHGNAAGIGLADVISRRLYAKIDVDATYVNVSTSAYLERGKTPIAAPTDAEAYACALRACGPIAPGRERVARMLDTLHASQLYVSPAVRDELTGQSDVQLGATEEEMFDTAGRLRACWSA